MPPGPCGEIPRLFGLAGVDNSATPRLYTASHKSGTVVRRRGTPVLAIFIVDHQADRSGDCLSRVVARLRPSDQTMGYPIVLFDK